MAHMWEHGGAFDEAGVVEVVRLEPAQRRVEQEKTRRTAKAFGTLDVMDVLLGNSRRDLAEIGYVTLQRWEERMKEVKESR